MAGWWLAAAGLVLVGCTFEHRGNGNGEPGAPPSDTTVEGDALEAVPDRGDLALELVRTYREATARGDLSLALSLMARDASMADVFAGTPDPELSRGEMLLELRAHMAEGYVLREDSARVHLAGEVTLVFSELVLEARDDEPRGSLAELAGRRVQETVVLVPTEQGWRIQHIHRSVAPTP